MNGYNITKLRIGCDTVDNVVPITKNIKGSEGMSNTAKKKERKPEMLTEPSHIIVREVPVGKLLKGKQFDSFETMRRKSNKIIGHLRNDWLNFIFMKNDIYINYTELTKREIMEIYDTNGIAIVNEDNVDRIFKRGQLLGEWNRNRKLYFNDNGDLMIEVKYSVL